MYFCLLYIIDYIHINLYNIAQPFKMAQYYNDENLFNFNICKKIKF